MSKDKKSSLLDSIPYADCNWNKLAEQYNKLCNEALAKISSNLLQGSIVTKLQRNCECGAHKVGSSMHSDWCQMHPNYKEPSSEGGIEFNIPDTLFSVPTVPFTINKTVPNIITSKGYGWNINPDGSCEDISTGLTWLPKDPGVYTYDKAGFKFGNNLPTVEEFKLAEEHGIREVFDDFKDHQFWSLTERSSSYAWYFSGYNGKVVYVIRNYFGSVRCIRR